MSTDKAKPKHSINDHPSKASDVTHNDVLQNEVNKLREQVHHDEARAKADKSKMSGKQQGNLDALFKTRTDSSINFDVNKLMQPPANNKIDSNAARNVSDRNISDSKSKSYDPIIGTSPLPNILDAQQNQLEAIFGKPIKDAAEAARIAEAKLELAMKAADKLQDKSQKLTDTQRIQLQKTVNDNCIQAIAFTDTITQTGPNSVNEKLIKFRQDHAAERENLAKELKLNPYTLTSETIHAKLAAPNLSAQDRTNLNKLLALQTDLEGLKVAQIAPALTRMMLADYKSSGLLDPPHDPKKQLRADNIQEAFTLMRQAALSDGTDTIRHSDQFHKIMDRVNLQYKDNLSPLSTQIIELISKGDKAAKFPNTNKPNADLEAYLQAYQLANKVDIPYIISLLKDNVNNPKVYDQLTRLASVIGFAHYDYAKTLNQRGRHEDALPILLELAGKLPWFVGKRRDDGTIDPSKPFEQELNNAYRTVNTNDSPQIHLQKFIELTNHKDYNAAGQELKPAYALATAHFDKVHERLTNCQFELDKLNLQRNQLSQSKDIDSYQKKALEQSLDNQIRNLNESIERSQQDLNNAKNLVGQLTYLQGYFYYLQGNTHAANRQLTDFKNHFREMAANSEYNIKRLLEETKDKAWYDINWKQALKVGGAVLAGIAVGALIMAATSWSGPGAIAAGAMGAEGVTGAILAGGITTTTVLGSGALAGGLTDMGITAIVDGPDKVNSRTFYEGAINGATGSSFVLTLGGSSAIFTPGRAAAPTIAKQASALTWRGYIAGIPRRAITGLTSGAINSGGGELGNVIFDGKGTDLAFWDALKGTGTSTVFWTALPMGNLGTPGRALITDAITAGKPITRGLVMNSTSTTIKNIGTPLVLGSSVFNAGVQVKGNIQLIQEHNYRETHPLNSDNPAERTLMMQREAGIPYFNYSPPLITSTPITFYMESPTSNQNSTDHSADSTKKSTTSKDRPAPRSGAKPKKPADPKKSN